MNVRLLASVAAIGLLGVGILAAPASAQTQPAPGAAAPPAAAPATPPPPPLIPLPYDLKLSGHVEGGTSINPDSPANNINFGQLFTDRDNSFRMNQATLALEKDLDPKNSDYQWGFRIQGMYGTDSRITHYFNEFDRATNSPYQWDVIEADAQAHLPTYGGGTDVKIGQYPTPLGEEVIDATGNIFYSHSYIFNYGLPFKHTGGLATSHISDTVDLWYGIDTGVNDSVGTKGMNNYSFPKALFGFGLNGLMDGNLTVLALAHIGPEGPRFIEPLAANGTQGAGPVFLVPGANSLVTQFYDAVITYKINDSWTSITELNYVRNDLLKITGGGVATYLQYALNDSWSLAGRYELFSDQNKGFGSLVANVENSTGYVNGERGLQPSIGYGANVGTPLLGTYNAVYSEITLGATYKPPLPSDSINAMIRPEIRYDTLVGGTNGLKPYNVNAAGLGTNSGQFTIAVDFILGF